MPSLKHVVPLAGLGLTILFASGCRNAPSQAKFATPDEAATALHQAYKTGDLTKIQSIFGPEAIEAVASRRFGFRPE